MAMAYAVVELEADEGSVLQMQYALRYVNGKPAETYGVGTTYTARAGRQHFIAGRPVVQPLCDAPVCHGAHQVSRAEDDRPPLSVRAPRKFPCSDEMLNRLWEMAVNTIETVSDDAYGSDARERNEWLQDPAEPNFITTRVALAGPGADGQ